MFQSEQKNFCLSALFTFLWRLRGFTSFSNFRGGSRGRGQGVRTPTEMTLRFSNTTGILQKNNVVYWC